MVKSKYMIDNSITKKDEGKFYNYYTDKITEVVDCYLIHLSNYETNISLKEFINKWKSI